MNPPEYLVQLFGELVRDLTANDAFGKWTNSGALKGAFAEATVRRLIRNVVSPLRVSHGGVVWEGNTPNRINQIDTIIWQPNPVPAIFEADDFALVPRGSAQACLEIKSTGYREVVRSVKRFQTLAEELFGFDVITPAILCPGERMLGVVCWLRRDQQGNRELTRLRGAGRIVVLLEESGKELRPQPNDIARLVNFLANVRRASQTADGAYLLPSRVHATEA